MPKESIVISDVIEKIKEEIQQLQLILEPDNPVDARAILVRNEKDEKLGYIPRVKNEVLFHLMDAGKYLYGVVVDGDIDEDADDEDTWVQIYIEVYMKD